MFRVVERSKLSRKFGNETFMDCHLSSEEEDAAAETRTFLLDTTFPPPNLSFEDFDKDVDEKRGRLLFVVVVVLIEITFFLVDVDDDFEDDFDDFEENKTGGFVTASNILNKSFSR